MKESYDRCTCTTLVPSQRIYFIPTAGECAHDGETRKIAVEVKLTLARHGDGSGGTAAGHARRERMFEYVCRKHRDEKRREDMIQNGAVKSLSPEERLAQPRSGHILGELWRHDVPAEGVALDGHASFERPVHDLVALSEIVHPLQNWKTRAKSQVAAQRSRASISSTPGRV